MATDFVTLTGEAYWLKVFEPDDFNGVKNYKAPLVVNKEELEKFNQSGIRTKVKYTDDDRPVILVKRPAEGKTMPNGQVLGGGRPLILDSEGEDWGNSGLIGNGSKLEVTVAVYDTRMGKGHRLEKIKVLKHVPVNQENKEPHIPDNKTEDKKVPF